MKITALANASINKLSLVDFRIESCIVPKNHEYVMWAAPIERVVYMVRGNACFVLENKEFKVKERDMVFLSSETAYRSKWLENSEFIVIDLLLRDIDGQPIRLGEEAGVLFNDIHNSYNGLLKELSDIATSNDPFDWLKRLSISFKFLCQIARDTNRNVLDEHKRKIRTGLAYLENNYNRDFHVEELAKMCCLSIGSFRHSFAECTGMSPVEYRNKLRIQKAITLLKSGKHTVGEVAEAVGINDIKYFSKQFKKMTGVSPSIYKKYTSNETHF